MIKRGYNVAGDTQYALPAACNLLKADRFMIGDQTQYNTAYCDQFVGERVLWLTRWTDPRSIRNWFKAEGGTQVNLWNEEEWWSKDKDYYFSPEIALPRLTQQLEWLQEVDATASLSIQIGVQWNSVGWAKKFNRAEWFAPVWLGLPESLRARIQLFNLHFYEESGKTNLGPVLDFVTANRKWMDRHGAANIKLRIGEIGLDKKMAGLGTRVMNYPERLFERMNAWNDRFGLGVEDLFIYCAGAYPEINAESQYVSLVEFGKVALTPYGESFVRAVNNPLDEYRGG